MPDQRGISLSPFLVILLPALLVVIGLVVDGGAQAAAARHAERTAAFAARAASDAAAGERLAATSGADTAAAAAAQAAVNRDPEVTGSVRLVDGTVLVRTEVRVHTALLSLIGINELTGRGSAQAELTADR